MSDMAFDTSAMEDQIATAGTPKKEIRRGLWIAGGFFGLLLGAAALIPLHAGAMAQGIVAVSGSRQLVQHREGGILSELGVNEGQLVRAGQQLALISQSSLTADERSLSGEVITLLAQRERLKAQILGLGDFAEPTEFAKLSKDDRLLADEAMRGQRQVLRAQRDSLGVQRGVLGQRAGQSRSMIDAAQYQASANREQRRLIGEELDGLRDLERRGYVSKTRVRELERAAAQLDGEYGALTAEMARSRQSIGETKLQSVSLGSQQVADSATEMREVQVRLAELQPRLVAAREQLARATVRAPTDGHVVDLRVHTVGGVIAPGETLMQIVPDNRELVIQAKMLPNDADTIKIGMISQVRFSSLHDRNLPALDGRISKVSADALEDQRTGLHYFTIEVIVPASELDKIRSVHGESAIRAGIPAEVLIPLKKRSALSYLLDPIFSTFWTSGRER
ncbi:MAG: HlyD family type I secretion periplasmic adaptor subunit [Novosphingobium sp.]|uniref:HlyD family type I secretion periplasmic adaptor subunit n=1 Tax=Novosphingobium sp. TaxID=1874826 RepID=UPI0032BC9EEC